MRRLKSLRILMLAVLILAIPAASFAGVFVNITLAPPALPVYDQPICPGVNYIWTPGYWAWGDGGYFWVPGTWVLAPQPGFLWTPGYWGWNNGFYAWNAGYWGPHIGYYGGVNYGFGYFGRGYEGGYWQGNRFFYNTTINRVNTTIIRNTYSRTVVNNVNVNRVSYVGGQGGLQTRPTPQEQAAARERHVTPTRVQLQHQNTASRDRTLYANVNHGRPAIAATARPNEFRGQGTVAAREAGAPYRPQQPNPANREPNNGRPAANNPRGENRPAQPARTPAEGNRTTQPTHTPPGTAHTPPEQNREQQRPQQRQEARPQPAPRQEARPQPAPRQEARPQPAPRQETRPQAAPRQEQRSAPQEHAPAPREERR